MFSATRETKIPSTSYNTVTESAPHRSVDENLTDNKSYSGHWSLQVSGTSSGDEHSRHTSSAPYTDRYDRYTC